MSVDAVAYFEALPHQVRNPNHDPKKSSVANLKAWRAALENKAGAVS